MLPGMIGPNGMRYFPNISLKIWFMIPITLMEPIINWEMELESEGLKLNKFQRVYLSLKKEEKSIPHFQAKNINF